MFLSSLFLFYNSTQFREGWRPASLWSNTWIFKTLGTEIQAWWQLRSLFIYLVLLVERFETVYNKLKLDACLWDMKTQRGNRSAHVILRRCHCYAHYPILLRSVVIFVLANYVIIHTKISMEKNSQTFTLWWLTWLTTNAKNNLWRFWVSYLNLITQVQCVKSFTIVKK